ncbi:hypothetical protein HanXRQr2_Chr05g0196091 [Helianthus annuus]|uniref:Uncharacterized protein n=1 Tax=Helianthus annuus TaxID=4232 RepID=A0A9K3IWB2_HELAN|nr:hypothetical protein HanXRQr2_Chr05g0196091 [Helianthus annuus]KAJ0921266.1 hypothetical protein HanPSC8_Chr05g0189491 [Helianthus annuus]
MFVTCVTLEGNFCTTSKVPSSVTHVTNMCYICVAPFYVQERAGFNISNTCNLITTYVANYASKTFQLTTL